MPFLGLVLGAIPVAFSALFFLVPLLRALRLRRQNAAIKEETLRRKIYAHVLASPSRVDPRDVVPEGTGADARRAPAIIRRIIDRLAASMKAEPIAQEKEGTFAYRFAELERELADLEEFRRNVDLKRYELGKTVFDSGQ